jgi:hypothetical protein
MGDSEMAKPLNHFPCLYTTFLSLHFLLQDTVFPPEGVLLMTTRKSMAQHFQNTDLASLEALLCCGTQHRGGHEGSLMAL